ncbi:hypothetical protein H9P43_008420 [Blastocladiella emersonii ATCC 22665]|nr:hypothetical protein H9P43_008420 [Blastocladiella emersonii ATCC 22665]
MHQHHSSNSARVGPGGPLTSSSSTALFAASTSVSPPPATSGDLYDADCTPAGGPGPGPAGTRLSFSRPVSMSVISPEAIAAKLDMATLARDFHRQQEHAAHRARRRRRAAYLAAALVLAAGAGLLVGFFIFWRKPGPSAAGAQVASSPPPASTPGAGSADGLPPRQLRDKPGAIVLPAPAGSSAVSPVAASAWIAVLPSATFAVTAPDAASTAAVRALADGYRGVLFPYPKCTADDPTKALGVPGPAAAAIAIALNATSVGSETYSVTVRAPNTVAVTGTSLAALAHALEVLAASMAAAGDRPGACGYRLPPITLARDAPAIPLRGAWVDAQTTRLPAKPSLADLVDVAAAAKLNAVVVRLPADAGFDRANTTLPSAVIADAAAMATARAVRLLPEIDLGTSLLWHESHPDWIACRDICLPTAASMSPSVCGFLNLAGSEPARNAQAAWWRTLRASLGGDVNGVLIGNLFHPDHLRCMRAANPNGADAVLAAHLATVFAGTTLYYPAAHTPPRGGIAGVNLVPVVGAAPGAPGPNAALAPPAAANGAAPLWYAMISPGSADSLAPATMPQRTGQPAPAGVVATVPSAAWASPEALARWMFPVAFKAWTGWTAGSAAELQAQTDAFLAWAVRGRGRVAWPAS